MQALQHHYTSCRKGLSGSAGFQTRTRTLGLQPDEQREAERRGGYAPPRDFPDEPTPDEIVQDFPRAFRYYLLESGKWALTYSCYVGQDYSRRWGNYFAHTLIGPETFPSLLWPIDFYEWDGWQMCLPAEDDTAEMPEPLPEVDLAAILPASSFILAELKEFLAESPGRGHFLEKMIRAVFLGHGTGRSLVIRDSFVNGLFWVACVQKAFPHTHVSKITFSTYQFSDRNCAAVNATTGETEFDFDEAQRNYQFYMFDFVKNRHSNIAETGPDYAQLVVGWMATDPDRLSEFHAFMQSFEHCGLDQELFWAARLFQLKNRDFEPTSEEWAAIISFADRFVIAQAREPLLEIMAQNLSWLRTSQDYAALIRFLAKGAALSGRREHRRLAFGVWLAMVDGLCVAQGADYGPVRTVRQELAGILREYEAEMAELFLSDSRLKMLQIQIPRLQHLPGVLEGILSETIESLHILHREPIWDQPEARMMMHAWLAGRKDVRAAAEQLLRLVGQDGKAVAGVCAVIVQSEKSLLPQRQSDQALAVGRALRTILADKKADFAYEVRRSLADEMAFDVLFGEWVEIVETSADRPGDYDLYMKIVQGLPGYKKKYASNIAFFLARNLSEKQRRSQAKAWLQTGEIRGFTEDFQKSCIKWANQGLSLEPADADASQCAAKLVRAAADLGVVLRPNYPMLRKAIHNSQDARHTFSSLPLQLLPESLTEIEPSAYLAFLSLFLEPALEKAANNHEKHGRIVFSVYQRTLVSVFETAYIGFLEKQPPKELTHADQGALRFWLTFHDDKTYVGLGHFRGLILKALIQKIVKHADWQEWLDSEITYNWKATRAELAEWRQMCRSIAEQQRSLWDKAKGILNWRG